jgi:hypothetical protein
VQTTAPISASGDAPWKVRASRVRPATRSTGPDRRRRRLITAYLLRHLRRSPSHGVPWTRGIGIPYLGPKEARYYLLGVASVNRFIFSRWPLSQASNGAAEKGPQPGTESPTAAAQPPAPAPSPSGGARAVFDHPRPQTPAPAPAPAPSPRVSMLIAHFSQPVSLIVKRS